MTDKRLNQETKCCRCGKTSAGYVPEIVDGCGNVSYECWDCRDKHNVSSNEIARIEEADRD